MTSNRLLLAAALLLCGSANADIIYLTDGKTLDEVTIVDETLEGVSYKDKGKSSSKSVAPDKVLRVEFTKKPRLVDEGDTMADEGAMVEAIDQLNLFADGALEGGKVREKWAVAYALRRVMDLNLTVGNLSGVVKAADKLIASRAESRYVPIAYLTKAQAQRWLGKDDDAIATLDAFKELIDAKGLSEGWRLEADLGQLLSDSSLSGSAKRDRLSDVVSAAGNDHPMVKNRAFVAQGESFLEETNPDFDAARGAFEMIIEDPSADNATLAGAYTGLGDCIYRQAAAKLQSGALDQALAADLREALKSYMRVIVVYKDQSRYVQKALFFAGRVFDLFDTDNDRSSARRMYRRLVGDFPASGWAEDAKKFL